MSRMEYPVFPALLQQQNAIMAQQTMHFASPDSRFAIG